MKKIHILIPSLVATIPAVALVSCNPEATKQYNVNVEATSGGSIKIDKNIVGQNIEFTIVPTHQCIAENVGYQINSDQFLPLEENSHNHYIIDCTGLKETDIITIHAKFKQKTQYELVFNLIEGQEQQAEIEVESQAFNQDIVFKVLPIQNYEVEPVIYQIGSGHRVTLYNSTFSDTYTIPHTEITDKYDTINIQLRYVPQTRYRLLFTVNDGFELGKDAHISNIHNVTGEPEITFKFEVEDGVNLKYIRLYIGGSPVAGPQDLGEGNYKISAAELAVIDSHEVAEVEINLKR